MEILDQLDLHGMLLMTAGAMCVGLVIAIIWIIRDDNRLEQARLERDYQLFKLEDDARKARVKRIKEQKKKDDAMKAWRNATSIDME